MMIEDGVRLSMTDLKTGKGEEAMLSKTVIACFVATTALMPTGASSSTNQGGGEQRTISAG
jgi:hypothetical protein